MFEFDLPSERIATRPTDRREDARMMIVDRETGLEAHSVVSAIGDCLRSGDLLVFNEAKVDPVRLPWMWKGKPEEVLFLSCEGDEGEASIWEAMVSGKKIPTGQPLPLTQDLSFTLLERIDGPRARIRIERSEAGVRALLDARGVLPLPPYIVKRRKNVGEPVDPLWDRERYQTVLARRQGAVAAPTAGLHFSTELLQALRIQGVQIETIFLGVGLGTFQPLTPEHWSTGKLHVEPVSIDASTTHALSRALEEGRRIVAIGTTAARTLEWWGMHQRPLGDWSSSCDLFLKPPWKPGVISGLLTNFHLPGTSLLALVAGFLGGEGEARLKRLYEEAIAREYRFFSYGDCMLIL